MPTVNHWKTGFALALTIAIGYTVCAAAYALWPEQGIGFLNALFHGLDFHRLAVGTPFTLATFAGPLLVMSVWGFLMGTLFSWLHGRLKG